LEFFFNSFATWAYSSIHEGIFRYNYLIIEAKWYFHKKKQKKKTTDACVVSCMHQLLHCILVTCVTNSGGQKIYSAV
jgi:hypothetical protein